MPRAKRYFLPGCIWHITHRCHKKEFLLKFSRDRQRWIHGLFEAKHRYGLCVLNYVVTSNHIHLLVKDTDTDVISRSLQLIAGRTGQEYNNRKNRKGAYWEDRYHATAVESETHLFKCLVYMDLNMVRAGVVSHPQKWAHGGYQEIQNPPKRYRIIDTSVLMEYCDVFSFASFQDLHRNWVEDALQLEPPKMEDHWTQSIAVGSKSFVDQVYKALGVKGKHRNIIEDGSSFCIKESCPAYNAHFAIKMDLLRVENTIRWDG